MHTCLFTLKWIICKTGIKNLKTLESREVCQTFARSLQLNAPHIAKLLRASFAAAFVVSALTVLHMSRFDNSSIDGDRPKP